MWNRRLFAQRAALAMSTLAIAIAAGSLKGEGVEVQQRTQYIVQGASTLQAKGAVEALRGQVTNELGIIRAVAAELTSEQVQALREKAFKVTRNRALNVSARKTDNYASLGNLPETDFPAWVNADVLHNAGIDGRGVGIAVLDTGLWKKFAKKDNFLAWADVVGTNQDAVIGDKAAKYADDPHGHGTHLSSIALGYGVSKDGKQQGIAPAANLIVVRAFEADGSGNYIDVIEGLDWIVRHKAELGIQVLNLSFGAAPQSLYWQDPLNLAVMAVWDAGIVVVSSAGNQGPDPLSITVPGNVPYVITVGAASNNQSADDLSDDFLTSFSSAGPSYSGFIKPELIAPGDAVLGQIQPRGELAKEFAQEGEKFLQMSGTSQASAAVTGVVALMLQADPSLSPDDVKCRLLSSARAAVDSQGKALYSVFQQGAGFVDAHAAVQNQQLACANQNLDLAAELRNEEHYYGPARQSEDGSFYLVDESAQSGRYEMDGYIWGGEFAYSSGYPWGGRTLFNEGYPWGGNGPSLQMSLWSQGYPWGGRTDLSLNGYPWGGNGFWINGYPWGGRTGFSVNGYPWGGNGFSINGYPWGGNGVSINGYPWGGSGISINAWLDTDLGITYRSPEQGYESPR